MRDFHINIKSSDSITHFPENNSSAFTISFPIDLHVGGDNWRFAVVDISHPKVISDTKMLTLYCDAVTSSIVDGELKEILRRFPNKRFDGVAYSAPQYIKPKTERIAQMSFTLRGDNNSSVEFEPGDTFLTLHFQIDF